MAWLDPVSLLAMGREAEPGFFELPMGKGAVSFENF
jgi:hypothetical protein